MPFVTTNFKATINSRQTRSYFKLLQFETFTIVKRAIPDNWHECDGLLGGSVHVFPVQPFAHEQVYEVPLASHVPPFMQGFESHGSQSKRLLTEFFEMKECYDRLVHKSHL